MRWGAVGLQDEITSFNPCSGRPSWSGTCTGTMTSSLLLVKMVSALRGSLRRRAAARVKEERRDWTCHPRPTNHTPLLMGARRDCSRKEFWCQREDSWTVEGSRFSPGRCRQRPADFAAPRLPPRSRSSGWAPCPARSRASGWTAMSSAGLGVGELRGSATPSEK